MFKKITSAIAFSLLLPSMTHATELPGTELYPGEAKLYEAALEEGLVVSFDTGPTWANWGTMFKRFKERYQGMDIVYNDLGSAATVVALDKAKRRPQADTAYYFAASGIDAANKGLTADFRPLHADKIPPVFQHETGQWFTIHTLNMAFLVNKKLVDNVPESWADLLKPEYRNSIVYQDPRSTGQGQVVVLAANFGAGGDMDNFEPGIEYLAKLHGNGNVLRVTGTTPYAQFLKGEIPIWIGYENDGFKAMVNDGMQEDIAVIIPKEASAAAPYAISKVKNGPNPNAAELWLNYIMSSEGQQTFAEGFVRPVLTDTPMPQSVAGKLKAAPQIQPVDLLKAGKNKAQIDDAWTQRVLTQG
ncbi:extracellular solute-binding protein [Oceanisphaera ostreae]|uniref:Extracellular solute-binding protein n=1 Tax=Oceanisphaera ostreae TaxID=914151 RepID=A0ABW3KGK1_9GAMM